MLYIRGFEACVCSGIYIISYTEIVTEERVRGVVVFAKNLHRFLC